MLEVFALLLYSVQWLGVVLGVGAETVLLVAHLMARHERKPQWLMHVPGVRAAQGFGLALIIASGAGAIWYQLASAQTAVLLVPTFSFKWMLIGLLGLLFLLERRSPGRAWVEGFAGATWYALFLVHSVAPVAGWGDLFALYLSWTAVFGVIWSLFVYIMRFGAPKEVPAPALQPHRATQHVKIAPAKTPHPAFFASVRRRMSALMQARPKHTPPAPKIPAPMLAKVPPPEPMPAPAPVVVAPPPVVPAPKPTPPPFIPSTPIRVLKAEIKPEAPAPAPKPAQTPGLPVVEHLELSAPAAASASPTPAAPAPDEYSLPTIRVMPRTPEDVKKAAQALEFRAL